MKPWILASLATLTGIAAFAACSSSSNSGSPSGGDGGSTEGGGTGDGGSTGDGGGSSGGGHLPYIGTMTATKTSAATPVYALTGGFVAAGDAGLNLDASATSSCTGTVSGSCCFVPPGSAGDAGAADGGAAASLVSAGTITISDGTTAVAALNPGTNGGYAITSANNPSVKWQPGDTLSFSAAGATVQAFSGKVVTVQDLAGVTPALSPTAAATVPINADFVVKWTPGNGTTVRLFVDALKGTAQQGTITCDAQDSAGTVTVPTALLSHFAAGDTGIASLTRGNVTTVTGANATVELLSSVSTGGTLKFQ